MDGANQGQPTVGQPTEVDFNYFDWIIEMKRLMEDMLKIMDSVKPDDDHST